MITWRHRAILALATGIVAARAANSTGYIEARACAGCHAKIYETYQKTGMARSFYRLEPAKIVEDFRQNNNYYHEPSDTHFTMLERNGRYFLRRYQIGFEGQEANVDEKQIDFVIGSGNHVRTYLHRTAAGALLQLPLAWYAERGGYWAMNPGYDKADQPDSRRKISYECMFCHNGYPETPPASEELRADPIFTGALPEGIDCQRCHGPGRRHVEIAQTAGATPATIRSAIVNPARLEPARQMEVCMQCHLETTSYPLPHSILKYDRGPFSYRPGEPLSDFLLFFDHAHPDVDGERFQIVSSAYRLRMSKCFLNSNGRLGCTTCHDPHDVPRGTEAAHHYNTVCLNCHAATLNPLVNSGRHVANGDCITCHMPKRRTVDVVHAVMTDHYIQRLKPDHDLLADSKEPHEPEILYRGEVVPYYPEPFEPTAQNKLYLALAQVRENSNMDRGLAQLAAAIQKTPPKQPEFYVELGDAYVTRGQDEKAIPMYREAVQRKPDSLAGLLGLGNALEQSGQLTEAAGAFRRAAQSHPANASAWQKLGEVYVKQGHKTEALEALQKSLQLDPEVPETHYAFATLWSQPGGDLNRAQVSFREAIRLQPDYAQARMNLAILLSQQEHADEAVYEFEYSIRLRPDYALGHLNYGLMLFHLQRFNEARSQLEAVLHLSADPTIRSNAQRLLSQIGVH